MQLFNEITACKAKTEQLTAEVKVLKERLAAIQTTQQVPTSAVRNFVGRLCLPPRIGGRTLLFIFPGACLKDTCHT